MNPNETNNQNESLETTDSSSLEKGTDTTVSQGGSLEQGALDASSSQGGSAPAPKKDSPLKRLLQRFNIYLLLFVLVVLVSGAIVLVAWLANHGTEAPVTQTQSLTDNTLKQLANSDVTVGQPKQVLNVQSNAVFAGKVLVRDSLEVAGSIQVGSAINIPGITVSGNSVFDAVQVNKDLAVAGNSSFQGTVSTQKGLSVAGTGTFGGAVSAPQLSANTLQLNGDLNLTHHITAGGATPGRSGGSALGGGGSASVSGSDTAGSININTGSGAAAGCFVTINFTQRYNATPHVLVTPIGSAAASVGYYVNRTTSGFSVCANNTPPSGANFGFDYFVLD